jgi:hypothetical protein
LVYILDNEGWEIMDERELVQAVIDAGLDTTWEDNVEAMTTAEIAEASGLSPKIVRELLKAMIKESYIDTVYVLRPTMKTPLTGKLARVPGYMLTDEGKKALGSPMSA